MTDCKKDCESCEFFERYYLKQDTRFRRTGEGRCANAGKAAALGKKKFKKCENCDFYKPRSDKSVNRARAVEEVLREIEEHLSSIKQILSDGKD